MSAVDAAELWGVIQTHWASLSKNELNRRKFSSFYKTNTARHMFSISRGKGTINKHQSQF